jgi:hypothetical protein
MQTKKDDILAYLIELYKELYSHKNLFKMNFKYSIHEVDIFWEQMQAMYDIDIGKKPIIEEKISEEILALKKPDDIRDYLYNNHSKDDLLKKLSLAECSYLYSIIYSLPLKSNMRKKDALNAIEKYFKGISRAISMKP